MANKIPVIRATQLSKTIQKMGFTFIRQKGSHMFYAHADGRTTVIPNHPSETLDRGLLLKIV